MVRQWIQFSGVIMTSALVLFGCASSSDLDSMRGEINILKRDSFEMKGSLRAMKEQLASAAKEDSFNAMRESQASLVSQVSDLSKDIQNLRGRFDENKFFSEKTLRENTVEKELLRAQINSLEARMKELSEKISKLSDVRTSPPSQQPQQEVQEGAGKVPEQKPAEIASTKVYESAYNSFKEKKYKEAREQFGAFIKKFPGDALVANAHFWIGETYYAEKDYEGAILAYETLVKEYPKSEKYPGALLKQGMAFLEIGDRKTAKVIFEKLIEKFPSSPEAETAKKKKAEIESKLKTKTDTETKPKTRAESEGKPKPKSSR